MRDTGILGDEERVELVDGIVVPMSSEGPRHRGAVAKVASVLGLAYGPDARVWTQSMFLLADDSFRVPDLVVVRREIWTEVPDPADVALIVEVAETSRRLDHGEKARAYARWGAEHYWVIDLVARTLTAHQHPTPAGYAQVECIEEDAEIPLPGLTQTLRVAAALPPPGV